MSNLTTKDMLAIAVLQGDDTAAYALADIVQENRREGLEIIKPLREVVDVNNIRVVVFYKWTDNGSTPTEVDLDRTNKAITDWISGRATIFHLTGVDRIELYSLPTKEEELPQIDYPPRGDDYKGLGACYRG